MTLRARLLASIVGFRKFFTRASVTNTQDDPSYCPCCGKQTGRPSLISQSDDRFHCVAKDCPLARRGASWSVTDVQIQNKRYDLSSSDDLVKLAYWASQIPLVPVPLPRVGATGKAQVQPGGPTVPVRVVEVNDDSSAWHLYGEPSLRVQIDNGPSRQSEMRRLWVPTKNFETLPLKLTHGISLRMRSFDSDAGPVPAQDVTVYNPVGQAAIKDGKILVEVPMAPKPRKTISIPVSAFDPD